MTRPIKFRVWDDGKKEWLMGYGTGSLRGFDMLGECMLLGEWSQVIDTFVFERDGHKQDDLKLMQFTGLLDKNGKEIYEGDVLRNGNNNTRYEVLWSYGDCGFCVVKNKQEGATSRMVHIGSPHELENKEIIGNIYENPEKLALKH